MSVALTVTPCHAADIVAIPMVPRAPNEPKAVTGNEALNAPAATVTEDGIITALLFDDKLILAGAVTFPVSATVQVVMAPGTSV